MVFADIIKENLNKLKLKQKDLQMLQLSKNNKPTGWISNKIKGTQMPTEKQWKLICDFFGIENNYNELINKSKEEGITYNLELNKCNKILSNKGKSGTLNHLCSENKRQYYIQNYEGYPKSILKFKREVGLHPTQKPVKLLEFLIKTYTNENEVVLDNCAGSMSTAIACINTNRNAIMIEKDEKYFNIGCERIKHHILDNKLN